MGAPLAAGDDGWSDAVAVGCSAPTAATVSAAGCDNAGPVGSSANSDELTPAARTEPYPSADNDSFDPIGYFVPWSVTR